MENVQLKARRDGKVDPQEFSALCRSLRSTTSSLVTLRLPRCGLAPQQVQDLCQSLPECASVGFVDLSGNRLGDDGAALVGAWLATRTSLVKLGVKLWSNDISDDGAACLASALCSRHGDACISELDLIGNEIGDDGAGESAHLST